MAIARQLEIADELADVLETFLSASLPGTSVTRTYTPFVDDAGLEAAIDAAESMLVYVVPMRKTSALETRASDQNDYEYQIVFVERCDERGLPDNEWMDQRVTLVADAEEQFGDLRNVQTIGGIMVWAQESAIEMIFDPDAHAENGTFWSVWNLTLREVA